MADDDASEPVLIYTTWPDADSAEQAGRALVADRLAACVNILAPATAIYEWQGELQRDVECPMLVKSTMAKADGAVAAIRRCHPYDVPAVLVVPVVGGNPGFLEWIAEQTAAQTIERDSG